MTPTEELQLFEHVVATGSMSETARKLGVSAAEVSKYIGVLERRLVRLFVRPACGAPRAYRQRQGILRE